MSISNMMLFSGNANPRLALEAAEYLNIPMGKISVGRFSDGEVMVEVNENVRGRDVYIMQPICAPTNDNLMELLVMADALRRASQPALRQLYRTWVMPDKTVVHARHVSRLRPKSSPI